jgi:hypothetical protein
MKGIGYVMLLVGMAIVLFSIGFAFTFMPLFFARLHLVFMLTYVYEYNNAQLSLLTFLSLTEDGRPVHELIAEHLALSEPANLDLLLRDELELIAECARLSTPDEVLLETTQLKEGECELRYRANASIPLPYNPTKLVQRLSLEIG